MGAKISIDSSTLMNKGLEVIEAHHLFAMPYDRISVVVQPQSAIHSMVEYSDGSVKAHLGTTDMRIPIQFALSYPERWDAPVEPLDFTKLGSLEFAAPDTGTFRCLALARAAGERGGTLPCAMNAANEVAVAAFLAEESTYLGIAACVEAVMDAHDVQPVESLEQLEAVGRLGPHEGPGVDRGAVRGGPALCGGEGEGVQHGSRRSVREQARSFPPGDLCGRRRLARPSCGGRGRPGARAIGRAPRAGGEKREAVPQPGNGRPRVARVS